MTFNSWRLTAISLVVCVCSLGLSLLSLAIFAYPFGIMAVIGVIGSIGVSINAAIIIMTALQENEGAAKGGLYAIRSVVMDSSRHIISTTVTTFGGFLPLILEGSQFWPPFAMAIAGGVLLSTIISFSRCRRFSCWQPAWDASSCPIHTARHTYASQRRGNSAVNQQTSTKRKAYHHGNLRNTLIVAAAELIEERGSRFHHDRGRAASRGEQRSSLSALQGQGRAAACGVRGGIPGAGRSSTPGINAGAPWQQRVPHCAGQGLYQLRRRSPGIL